MKYTIMTSKPIKEAFFAKLRMHRFAEMTHRKKDTEMIKLLDKSWQDNCVNGQMGPDGEYYLGYLDSAGERIFSPLILDAGNTPAGKTPSLTCPWSINVFNNEVTLKSAGNALLAEAWMEYLQDIALTLGLSLVKTEG